MNIKVFYLQVLTYNKMTENLQENKVILDVDYSECYNNTQQDEIQTTYFGNSTFSIFNACSYILDQRNELPKVLLLFLANAVTTRESRH